MASVKKKLAAYLEVTSPPQWFEPIGLLADIDRHEHELAALSDDDAEQRLVLTATVERLRAELAEQRFPFRIQQLSDADARAVAECADQARAASLANRPARQALEVQFKDELEGQTDAEIVNLLLELEGKGTAYLDPKALQTPRTLLQCAVDRMREDEKLVVAYASPETALGLATAIDAVEIDAQIAQYDDYLQGFQIWLSEQERTELSERAADEPDREELAKARDAAFTRHLKLELERRGREVKARRKELTDTGREKLVQQTLRKARDAMATVAMRQRYIAELIAAMVQIPDGDVATDEQLSAYQGNWVRAFDQVSEVDAIQGRSPELFMALRDSISQLGPDIAAAQLVGSAPFRPDVGEMPI